MLRNKTAIVTGSTSGLGLAQQVRELIAAAASLHGLVGLSKAIAPETAGSGEWTAQ